MNLNHKLLVLPPCLMGLKQVHDDIKDKPWYNTLYYRLSHNFNDFTVEAASNVKPKQSTFIPTFPLPENAEYAGDLGCQIIKYNRKRLFVAHAYKGITKKALDAHRKFLRIFRIDPDADFVYCPSHLHLDYVKKTYPETVKLGIQNIYPSDCGNYAGEVNLPMARDLGVKYVLIGTNHRRAFFGETNKFIQAKVRQVLSSNMNCLIFLSNTSGQDEECHRDVSIIKQLNSLLPVIKLEDWGNVSLAYESVSESNATTGQIVEEAQRMCKMIRNIISSHVGNDIAQKVRILYSGEINHEVAPEIMAKEDVDGLVFSPKHNNECFVNIINSGLLADYRKEKKEQEEPTDDSEDSCITVITQQ